jgi:hypothetical protein
MSKKIKELSKVPGEEVSWGRAYLTNNNTPNYLIGRLFTIVEAMGLKETQEKSVKDLFQNEVWTMFSKKQGTEYLSVSVHNEIRKIIYKEDDKDLVGGECVEKTSR